MSLKSLLADIRNPDDILPVLRNAAQVAGVYDGDERKPGFHPSEMSGLCVRRTALNKWVPQAAPDDEGIGHFLWMTFEIGTMLHLMYQNTILGPAGVLEGWWINVTTGERVYGRYPKHDLERPVNGLLPWPWMYEELHVEDSELGITGHYDGLLCVPGEEDPWMFELKTINPMGYKNLEGPSDGYMLQMQTYMRVESEQRAARGDSEITKCLLVYCNKSPIWGMTYEKPFVIERDDDYTDAVFESIRAGQAEFAERRWPKLKCVSRTDGKNCSRVEDCFGREPEFEKFVPADKVKIFDWQEGEADGV